MPSPASVAEPIASINDAEIEKRIGRARESQRDWAERTVAERLKVVRRFRHLLASRWEDLAAAVTLPPRADAGETLAAEILPLAAACRFLERNAERVLRQRQEPRRDRPFWCWGVNVATHRRPFGVVLVLGPWNYPLFLTGVQTLQGLVAGNAVVLKPGRGAETVTRLLRELLWEAGLPDDLLPLLGEAASDGQQAIAAGVDKIVLTGSAQTGRAVLAAAARQTIPCTMELSGCDAVFVLPGADLGRVAACLEFGLRFNGSATCIAPRRVFATGEQLRELMSLLSERVAALPPVNVAGEIAEETDRLVRGALQAGGRLLHPKHVELVAHDQQVTPTVVHTRHVDTELLQADLFAPVLSLVEVDTAAAALQADRCCSYALGASVFGPSGQALAFAQQVEAGCVTVNDVVAPTADPRVPFGGWRASGFGVTRGREGLLDMTRVQAIVEQKQRQLLHHDPPSPARTKLLASYLEWMHGDREQGSAWRRLWRLLQAARNLNSNNR